MTTQFSDLNLRPELMQALEKLNYAEPTPIQAQMIPIMLTGVDVIGQAQTGTGKTAAFSLPILENLIPEQRKPQALVLSPTRELAMQVAKAMDTYGAYMGVRVLAIYGGSSYGRQISALKRGVDVVVGTPGRLLDLLKKKSLNLGEVRTLVLDEADEMLSMGFIEDIETLLDATATRRQVALFSATMPSRIRQLSAKYLNEPHSVIIKKKHILRTFLAFVALAMLTGIAAVLLPNGWIDDEILATIFITGAYSLAGIFIIAAAPKQGQLKWTLRICATSLTLSMVIFLILLWFDSSITNEYDDYFWKPATIALILGTAAAHRLMIVPLKVPLRSFTIIKRAALISAAITTFIVTIGLINEEFWFWEDIVVNILAISTIIAAGSSIATGAIALFAPKPGDDEQSSFNTTIPIHLTCPRCQSSIQAQSNKDARCQSCKLKIRIQIQEPRCTCGYLLYQLNSETCPECGKNIPQSEQWETQTPSTTQ
ncbi:MAG: DEAD/DEAH box helicase [Anaerolineales bacterium]|nr:DEAD/DEAH box helicase [Anaerolineales bacterium]